jgi:hypothetical protein
MAGGVEYRRIRKIHPTREPHIFVLEGGAGVLSLRVNGFSNRMHLDKRILKRSDTNANILQLPYFLCSSF